MTQRISIVNDQTSADPIILRVGDVVGFSIPVPNVTTLVESVTLSFYKENTNKNTEESGAVYWSTTACTVTGGNTVVTGLTQSLKAGNWIISINGTVDGLAQNIITIPVTVKIRGER